MHENMLGEVNRIIGLDVYTPQGVFVGVVDNVVLDLSNKKIDGLFVQSPNKELVEKGTAVNIPFRWVQSVGDIIILRVFPKFVNAR